jgi:hypothetical protein
MFMYAQHSEVFEVFSTTLDGHYLAHHTSAKHLPFVNYLRLLCLMM